MRLLILRSVKKNTVKDSFSIKMDTRYSERIIGHLKGKSGFCTACGNTCKDCRNTYDLDFSNHIVDIIDFPAVLPAILEDPEEFIPTSVKPHDIILALSVNEEILISFLETNSMAKGVIIPIEDKDWISSYGMEKISKICKSRKIEVAFPKPFCSFNPSGNGILWDFRRFFKIGKPELELTCEGNTIVDARILISAPCGATYFTAKQLISQKKNDDLKYCIDKQLSCFPCTASTKIDDDFQDSIIHQAVKIQRDILGHQ
jgi:hypothetical protein